MLRLGTNAYHSLTTSRQLTSMIDVIRSVRSVVRDEGHVLTPSSLESIAKLCVLPSDTLATPEFGKAEYLLNCDTDGSPLPTSPRLASALLHLPPSDPPWIQVVETQTLVLRWLAHFVGLRHRAVHLFLDHPDHPDCTFVQIRSLSKYNQPGQFDMPVAGHVDALDTSNQALSKELSEELGLNDRLDLLSLKEIGTYNIAIPDSQPDYDEVEHTTLYRGQIRPEAIARVQLQKREVGGLVLFRNDELTRWIGERSDQIGGGLADSWNHYR